MTTPDATAKRFRTVRVSGGPRQRGVQFGAATRAEVPRSVATYAAVFRHMRGWDWKRATDEAVRYEQAIGDFDPRYLDEIDGIAEGAGVDRRDILALNVRTEIMFGTGLGLDAPSDVVAECTSFAAVPERTGGRVLIGQNWDWLVGAAEQIVVLESIPDDGPAFVTVVEAGLLAKIGFNAAGLGVATNALITDSDRGRVGVPLHVTLRALFDCRSIAEAVKMLERADRSSSGNYLIASDSGEALDIEAVAGGPDRLLSAQPVNGFLRHTNHFVDDRFDGQDVLTLGLSPSSALRLDRIGGLAASRQQLDPSFFLAALSDHEHGLQGICLHGDADLVVEERPATLCSLVIDLGARRMWLAAGRPCEAGYAEYDYAELLAPVSA